MADTGTEPPESRRKRILDQIQNHENDVLTTREIYETFGEEVSYRTTKRDLNWMTENGIIESRKVGQTLIWWINPKEISAEESVVAARQVTSLLKGLYEGRREFRVMAIGLILVWVSFSVSAWIAILSVFNVEMASISVALQAVGIASIFAFLLIFGALFLFPIETLGDWTDIPRSED